MRFSGTDFISVFPQFVQRTEIRLVPVSRYFRKVREE